MRGFPCRFCRNTRLILLSALLGGGSGLAAHAAGWSANWSMSATFVGAIAPLLWFARRQRRQGAAAGVKHSSDRSGLSTDEQQRDPHADQETG